MIFPYLNNAFFHVVTIPTPMPFPMVVCRMILHVYIPKAAFPSPAISQLYKSGLVTGTLDCRQYIERPME